MDAHRLQRDRQEAAADLLAGGNDRVILAGIEERGVGAGDLRHVLHPADQFVGLSGHRRDDHRHFVAGIDLAFDVTRHIVDAVKIGDGRPAEFHHDARHELGMSRKRMQPAEASTD